MDMQCSMGSPGDIQTWLHPDRRSKHLRSRKVYWFKTCGAGAYYSGDFSAATRCREVELLVLSLLGVLRLVFSEWACTMMKP